MAVTSQVPIVVGVDGSPSAGLALEWAVREAALRRLRLAVVHAVEWPLAAEPDDPDRETPDEDVGGMPAEYPSLLARSVVAEAVGRARELAPGVQVTGRVVPGPAARALRQRSRHASAVVVGHRGRGGFDRLLVGSVAVQVAEHAAGPVVVVREPGRFDQPDLPVVVGVDGSELSELALGYAFDAAARRGLGLLAVRAWTTPHAERPGDMLPPVYDPEAVSEAWAERLDEMLGSWRDKYPDVRVTTRVRHERPARVLVEESARARLLVVGARGYGGFRGLLLGSVSQALIQHARCPVAVVRTPHAHRSYGFDPEGNLS